MREVKASARQAEEAERARAEIETRARGAAERNVHAQQLHHRQERISRVLEETKDHFRHAAFHDSLTGLPNRAMFTELLKPRSRARSAARPTCSQSCFSILMVQEHQRQPRHTHGDLLLVAFAERLERTLRPVDTLARFGR